MCAFVIFEMMFYVELLPTILASIPIDYVAVNILLFCSEGISYIQCACVYAYST